MIGDISQIIKSTIEIFILWVMFYRVLVFFEGTRAFQVLKGIVYLLVLFLFSIIFDLKTINWLLTNFFAISIIALLIIFQQELRQGLARLGQQNLFSIGLEESQIIAIIDQITLAIYKLSARKIGCLIAIEKSNKLDTYIESGVIIDGKVCEELLQSIFVPAAPLHDGGVILRGEKIIAASCLFPLSENPSFSKITGTRHRAVLGLSEQTDAVVIMVSEENGEVAMAADGKFFSITGREQFVSMLKEFVIGKSKKK